MPTSEEALLSNVSDQCQMLAPDGLSSTNKYLASSTYEGNI